MSTEPAKPARLSDTRQEVPGAAPETLAAPTVPAKVTTDGLEERWGQAWENSDTYRFARGADRSEVFSIDTPPPTVSGSLHVGHVFSYTHTDLMARYMRMRGKKVFYPMGWDDNGLPTERRVQNYYGVRCDPSLPYEENFEPPQHGGEGKSIKNRDQKPISRKNFIELCEKLTAEDEQHFEDLWRRLGLSVDWQEHYQTIGPRAQKVAQTAFLRNLARGEAYQAAAPGLWDITFQTAVAQAELEAREYPGHYHTLGFMPTDKEAAAAAQAAGAGVDEDGRVLIETTRPELLAACCALIAHPDDERFQPLFGTTVTSPGFAVEVPVLAHPAAEMDKGAGIAMCCTFGDLTDVQWWRELDLPMRTILGKNGRIIPEIPEWISHDDGRALYEQMAGKTAFSARAAVVDYLREHGGMVGEPTPTQRMANFFEKGDKPLEIVSSRQWYIRNGGRTYARHEGGKDLRDELLARGDELAFHPDFMRVRYANWVSGLNSDWLISRQRFFGVPLPLWYRIDENGVTQYDQVLTPEEDRLPIDPTVDVPTGYSEDQRGKPGGFEAERDIMDTWATSSLTPQIAGGWLDDEEKFASVFPMDMRAQGQDIIRTWLFSTVVRSHLEHDCLPWSNAAISGWILDSDRKKMSKSKGNVVTPMGLLEKYGSDAVRYWAASARLGADPAFEEMQIKIGRRLAIKLLNASKFALTMAGDSPLQINPGAITEPVDKALIAGLAEVVAQASEAFSAYNHTRALEVAESYFWSFCDDYLELVKDRAYNRDSTVETAKVESARAALNLAVDTFVRLFAPFLPFATEEVWNWYRPGSSVHHAQWPEATALTRAIGEEAPSADLLSAAGAALAQLRKIKSEQKVSQRTAYHHVTIAAPAELCPQLELVHADLRRAAHVEGELSILPKGDEITIADYLLAEPPAKK